MLPPFTIPSDGLQHHLTQAIVVLLITRRYQSTGAAPAPRVFRRHRHNILLPICLRMMDCLHIKADLTTQLRSSRTIKTGSVLKPSSRTLRQLSTTPTAAFRQEGTSTRMRPLIGRIGRSSTPKRTTKLALGQEAIYQLFPHRPTSGSDKLMECPTLILAVQEAG